MEIALILCIWIFLLVRQSTAPCDYTGHRHEEETRDGWYYNYGEGYVEFVSRERLKKKIVDNLNNVR